MSKEKLYAVKNDDGKYWDFSDITGFWSIYLDISDCPTTTSKKQAELVADEQGGHIVTFVEEPEKLVLSKEQAEIVEKAHADGYPASYISDNTGACNSDEILLINAYANGYTVVQEKKYNVKVPHSRFYYWKWKDDEIGIGSGEDDDVLGVEPYRFIDAEIEHYGLQDCEKVEVADDEE